MRKATGVPAAVCNFSVRWLFMAPPKKFITIFFPFNARACMFVSNLFLCYYQSQGNDPVNKHLYGCFSTFCFQRLTKCSLVLLFLLSLFHLRSTQSLVLSAVFFVKLICVTMETDNDNNIWSTSSKVCFPPQESRLLQTI